MMRGVLVLAVAVAVPVEAGAAGFDVASHSLVLTPDLAAGTVSGTEEIRFVSGDAPLSELRFSANALEIAGATLDGRAVSVRKDGQGTVFVLSEPLAAGRPATLRFRFSGKPARGVTAVPGALYTSYFACDWMVCRQDEPGDKAALSLDLVLPAGARSLGVGRLAGRQRLDDGRVVHRWRSDRAYSPYLYAFAAGTLSERVVKSGSGTLRFLDASGGKSDLGALFADSAGIAAFFAGKAGMPLPGRSYAQLLVPGDEAQETATFSLIGKEELEAEKREPGSAWIIAHEMAHQWWGNLVTCESWQHFWLNEGMAVFMTAAWKEQRFGAAAYAAEIDHARKRAERAKAKGQDRPLAWGGKYDSLGDRRDIQYGKSAVFLDRLRRELGDEAFWAGVRLYTRRHAGGTVTSADFQRAMEEASRRDLGPLFREWVTG